MKWQSALLVIPSLFLAMQTNIANAQEAATPVSGNDQEDVASAARLSRVFKRVARIITPSVVNISTFEKQKPAQAPSGPNGQLPQDPFFEQFREFFGEDLLDRYKRSPQGVPQQGLGTGVIFDTDGHIITNNHVVAGADGVQIQFNNNPKKFSAEVIGTDPRSDIAVLKVNAPKSMFVPAKLGDSDKLEIGEWVVASGNPFGLDNSITAGIVSAKGRSLMNPSQYEDFIQTDAAINPGNSGGPLVNLDGYVVGINTAIFSRSGGYMGIGFAIPSNMVQSVVSSLIDNGRVARGWLGVSIQDLTEDLAHSFKYDTTEGALVGQVQKGGPAEKSGVKSGDIIISVDGKAVSNINQLKNIVASIAPGKEIPLVVVREGQRRTIPVMIGELPSQPEESIKNQTPEPSNQVESKIGVTLETLNAELASRLRSEKTAGAVITSVAPGSLGAQASLRSRDIILNINGVDVTSASQANSLLTDKALAKGVRLVVETQGMERFVLIKAN